MTVDGMVQGVGYRYLVKAAAFKHGLTGYVKNLDDGRVEVVCEGEEEKIRSFLDDVQIRREPVSVENVEVAFEEPTREFPAFRIVAGELVEEMVDGFSTGALYLNLMLGKQDQMLGKQDETTGEIRGLRKTLEAFLEDRFRRLEGDISQIKARLGMA